MFTVLHKQGTNVSIILEQIQSSTFEQLQLLLLTEQDRALLCEELELASSDTTRVLQSGLALSPLRKNVFTLLHSRRVKVSKILKTISGSNDEALQQILNDQHEAGPSSLASTAEPPSYEAPRPGM